MVDEALNSYFPTNACDGLCNAVVTNITTTDDAVEIRLSNYLLPAAVEVELPYHSPPRASNANAVAVNAGEQLILLSHGIADACRFEEVSDNDCSKHRVGPNGLFNWQSSDMDLQPPNEKAVESALDALAQIFPEIAEHLREEWQAGWFTNPAIALRGLSRQPVRLPRSSRDVGAVLGTHPATGPLTVTMMCFLAVPPGDVTRVRLFTNDDMLQTLGSGSYHVTIAWLRDVGPNFPDLDDIRRCN
jgi:hypothetical protein